MTIYKTFKTLRQAERYQNSLYNKYELVQLVKAPRFSEAGQYAWQVSKGGK